MISPHGDRRAFQKAGRMYFFEPERRRTTST